MADLMTFPNTWEEYERSYGFTDTEEIYTNGARLIPSFRVEQWLEHIALDCISRQAAIDGVKTLHDVAWKNWHEPTLSANVVLDMIRELPPAQPQRKNGKWVQAELEVGFVTCSYCKEHKIDGRMALRPDYANMLRFCPNCGADMREKQDG